jgi:hypothetical protein
VAEVADVRPESPEKSEGSVWWAVLASAEGQLAGPSATLGAPPPVALGGPAGTAAPPAPGAVPGAVPPAPGAVPPAPGAVPGAGPAAPAEAGTGGSEVLARRVPGTHLTPALRRGSAPDGASGATSAQAPDRDPERMRSMLSRFQASQRAGREADPGAPDPPQEGR